MLAVEVPPGTQEMPGALAVLEDWVAVETVPTHLVALLLPVELPIRVVAVAVLRVIVPLARLGQAAGVALVL
jgi:hypothetical protein